MNVGIGTTWPRSSFSGNICFEFSALCLCSAAHQKKPSGVGTFSPALASLLGPSLALILATLLAMSLAPSFYASLGFISISSSMSETSCRTFLSYNSVYFQITSREKYYFVQQQPVQVEKSCKRQHRLQCSFAKLQQKLRKMKMTDCVITFSLRILIFLCKNASSFLPDSKSLLSNSVSHVKLNRNVGFVCCTQTDPAFQSDLNQLNPISGVSRLQSYRSARLFRLEPNFNRLPPLSGASLLKSDLKRPAQVSARLLLPSIHCTSTMSQTLSL